MRQRTSLHVEPSVRDRIQVLKYEHGHSSVNETVEYLLEEVESNG